MFNEIKLNPETQKEYVIKNGSESTDTLTNLSLINIFIGSNNSGKSRLLREFFVGLENQYMYEGIDFSETDGRILSVIEEFKKILVELQANNTQTFSIDVTPYFTVGTTFYHKSFKQLDALIKHIKHTAANRYGNSERVKNIAKRIDEILNTHIHEQKQQVESIIHGGLKRYYIPTLRSLKDIAPTGGGENKYRDSFSEITIRHYFEAMRNKYEHDDITLNLFTGLTFYDEIHDISRDILSIRAKKENFEKFLSESFFNSSKVQITSEKSGKTLIAIGDVEHPIEHLGDGIQSIIILTYKLFMHQGERAMFFFEEPETHLHPGYQRLFIETLRKPEFNTFQYFISTHSNHFLDITLENSDMSVFTFLKHREKDNAHKFYVENVANGDDNVLQLIGANKSSVFLSNSTIWVEGITDRLYLRAYIDLYQKNVLEKDVNIRIFKEDYHYSFVEYGGGNITHWSFLDSEDEEHKNINVGRLCAKAFVVTDSDNVGNNKDGTPSKKKLRQEALQNRLGDRYYCIKSREIENTLTKQIIEKIIISYEAENAELDFKTFHKKSISSEYLGTIIEKTVRGLKSKTKYAKESGTINDKIGFAKKAVEHMKTYDDLSDEAKTIAEKLYKFIESQNP